MTVLVVSSFTSFVVAMLLVRSASRHARLSADDDLSGPQKFHSRPVPRVGGVAVLAAVLAGTLAAQLTDTREVRLLWLLIAASLPTFVSGMAEDLTKVASMVAVR
jgi:UDP-N-acetylmuramyl pentapeptide phosphotransferase/UDP-N-acetylglucosamine-1-phosphate transferase